MNIAFRVEQRMHTIFPLAFLIKYLYVYSVFLSQLATYGWCFSTHSPVEGENNTNQQQEKNEQMKKGDLVSALVTFRKCI